jgi:uncharacterized protein (TIGR02145 family)
MKRKVLLFSIPVLLIIGISLFIVSCESETEDPPTPAATSIQLVSGSSQSSNVDSPLASPIVVLVKDQDGSSFQGATVKFSVSEGSVSSGTVTTDSQGNASVTWTLGATVGSQTLTVSAFKTDGTTSLSGSPLTVTASANANIEANSIEIISGGDQTAEVESTLGDPILVLVKDQDGNAFQGATVNFSVAEGSVSSASEVTDANGNASVSWTLGATSGTQALTVTASKADGTTALTGSPITVNATATVKDAASIELLSGGDQTGLTDAQLGSYIKVLVKDANGDPFPGASINYSLTEGSVPQNELVTASNGEVSTKWLLGPTEGTQTLTITAFKADGTTPLTGSPLIVNATATGPVAEYIKVDYGGGDDQTGKANTPLLDPIIIKVYAGGGLSFEGETVNFEVTEGSVSQATVLTDADGLASVIWTLGPTVGTQTLTVTCYKADGTTHLTNSPLLVNATAEAGIETGTLTDYDGNVYQTVKIGEQWWMAENLKVTHLPDGTAITKVTGDTDWKNLGVADQAYCFENDNDATEYGALYSRSAALNGDANSATNPSGIQGVCPAEWHIPSDAEWKVLLAGGASANVLKEPGTTHWLPPSESNNETGFTAFGGGYRNDYDGTTFDFKKEGVWWVTDLYAYNGKGACFYIGYASALSLGSKFGVAFDSGRSIRCVKD